jgi:hypothetical protein
MSHATVTFLTLVFVAAWMVHLGWTLRQVDELKFALGILGCVVSPLGAFHGVLLLLGI